MGEEEEEHENLIQSFQEHRKTQEKLQEEIDKLEKEQKADEDNITADIDRAISANSTVQQLITLMREMKSYEDYEMEKEVRKLWASVTRGMGKEPVHVFTDIKLKLDDCYGDYHPVVGPTGLGKQYGNSRAEYNNMSLGYMLWFVKNRKKIEEHIRPTYKKVFNDFMDDLEKVPFSKMKLRDRYSRNNNDDNLSVNIKVRRIELDGTTLTDETQAMSVGESSIGEKNTGTTWFDYDRVRETSYGGGRKMSNDEALTFLLNADTFYKALLSVQVKMKKSQEYWIALVETLKKHNITQEIIAGI